MTLQSFRQLETTKEKLRELQERYEEARTRPMKSEQVRELTLWSLKRLINQLTEEIIRFEARVRPAGPITLPLGATPPVAEHQPPTPSP